VALQYTFHTPLARYSVFVLKVPLDTNKPNHHMHFHNFHNERYTQLHSQLCLSNYMALVIIVTFKNANNVAKANAMSKSTENHTSTAYRTFLVNCNWKSHILPVSFARRTFSTMLGMSFKSRSSTELSVVSPYDSRELNQRLFSKSVHFSCVNNVYKTTKHLTSVQTMSCFHITTRQQTLTYV